MKVLINFNAQLGAVRRPGGMPITNSSNKLPYFHRWTEFLLIKWLKRNQLKLKYQEIFHISESILSSLSCAWLFVTLWTAARQASLSIIDFWSSPKLMTIESVMPSNHLILCHPLLLLPENLPSIRVFFHWVSFLHQVAKVLEFQHQHQSFQWTLRTDLL